MRKESKHSRSHDGVWATTVTMVTCPLDEKLDEMFWLLFDSFVAMAKYHCLITWEDGQHCHGDYDMLYYAIGCIATAQ